MLVRKFETPGRVRLYLRVDGGSVAVDAVEGATDTVVTVDGPASNGQDEPVIRTHQSGDRVDITVEACGDRLFGIFGLRPRSVVDVKVRCPAGADVTASSVGASIRLSGPVADTDLKTVSGDVSVDRVRGSLAVKSVGGDARAHHVGGDAKVETVSGEAELESVGGSAELRTISGDFQLDSAVGPVSFQSVSGDLFLGSVREGAVRVKTVSGDVRIGIRHGSRLSVDARSLGGSATSELPITDEAPDDSGPLVELSAFAASGDIRVVRAV